MLNLKVKTTNYRFLAIALMFLSALPSVFAAGAATQPSICSRSCWGSRSSGLNTNMSTLNRAIIHHTAGSGDYNVSTLSQSKAKVRGVQNLHMDANGWSDVGYHFLFDKLGNAFEGRRDSLNKSVQRRGAHDGNNTNSFGFSNLGYYHPPYNHTITTAQKNKLYDVIAWRMPNGWSPYGAGSYNGKTVGYLDGHRDVKATACPGDQIYNTIIGTNHSAGEARAQIWARIQGSGSSQQNDRLDIFVRGGNNNIYQQTFDRDGGGWTGSPWPNLGGDAAGRPTVCSWAEDRLDVFYRGTNGRVYHKWFTGSSWSPSSGWEDLGGSLASDMDAVSWGPGRIDLFGIDTSGDLVHLRYASGSGWLWQNHGAANAKAGSHPSVCAWGVNRLDIFVQGTDNALKHKWWNGSAWSGWEDLGGVLTSSPDSVSWGTNRIDVFVRGGGNKIYHKWYTGSGSWNGYENLGGDATGAPTAASWGEDRLDVFYRGTNGALKHGWWNGSEWSSAWEDLGGGLSSDPDAVSWND